MPMIANRRHILAGLGLWPALPALADSGAVADVVGTGRRWDADIGLVAERTGDIGYHTALKPRTWVHSTRSNLDYALRLLAAADNAPTRARAEAVIAKVLSLQDRDPASPTFGDWSWYVEEPLAAMGAPDLNWADFMGARLCELFLAYGDALSPTLRTDMAVALKRACVSITKRDVKPSYTNIAAMGARVTLLAGEIAGDPALVRYGRDGLARLLAYTREQGSFNEYNSPTYTTVALEEFEAVLAFAKDAAARRDAEALRQIVWTLIAEHWHPATAQWGGPHGRAYASLLQNDIRRKIEGRAGLDAKPFKRGEGYPMACPAALQSRFRALPSPETVIRRRFIRATDETNSIQGVTWLTPDACLGSTNAETFWVQRHAVIGYWPTAAKPAAFRVRVLKDGRDFASFAVRTIQDRGRVLLGVHPIAGAGDWHPTLDRSADGAYPGRLLQIRFQLEAEDAVVRAVSPGIFELKAGEMRALVTAGASQFDGRALALEDWRPFAEPGLAGVDATVTLPGAIHPAALTDTLIAAGVEVASVAAPVAPSPITVRRAAAGSFELNWAALEVRVPGRAQTPLSRPS